MSYTAIETMRETNKRRFGVDLGPMQPPFYTNRRQPNDLKSASLRFLRKRCVGLRFNARIEEEETATGVYQGMSLKAGQIPYNMQMDLNRLCLEKALEHFIDSGVAEDAYAVYYCYLEIFFGKFGESRKMVELLSEYEANGSSLLLKHRDHYSHSVYVFALGLAIYETNAAVRKAFGDFYKLDAESSEAANIFLEFWGMTALFHDIGYPFELPFEQVLSYFEVNERNSNDKRGKNSIYLSYRSMLKVTGLSEAARQRFEELFDRSFMTTNELLAFDITRKLGERYGFTESFMLSTINRKPTEPGKFNYFMDHAYFSAVRLYRELELIIKPENITEKHVDVLSAIMLHNSLYKFHVSYYKDEDLSKRKEPLTIELHPLAWLLMLCDELQCWDRTAYGRSSRKELHPFKAVFDFKKQAISAVYYYDQTEEEKIENYKKDHDEYQKNPEKYLAAHEGKKPRLKAYSDMADERSDFTVDIERIVNTSLIPLTVSCELSKVDRENKRTYLSESDFLHFYDFAVTLHARDMPKGTKREAMEDKFRACSLEYQLSTLGRARHFASYLNAIGCFYTDKPVDFEPVTHFGAKDAAIFAPMEHERWVREHQDMGWHFGREYEELPLDVPEGQQKAARAALREQLRRHKLCMDGNPSSEDIRVHYFHLPRQYQDKDWKPFNNLLELLKSLDGLRIYRLYRLQDQWALYHNYYPDKPARARAESGKE